MQETSLFLLGYNYFTMLCWFRCTVKWITSSCLVIVVVSDSLGAQGLQPTRFLCPRDFLGKDTGVGCRFLLQINCMYTCIRSLLDLVPSPLNPSIQMVTGHQAELPWCSEYSSFLLALSSTPGHIPWENHDSQRHMHPGVHCGNVYSSSGMEGS